MLAKDKNNTISPKPGDTLNKDKKNLVVCIDMGNMQENKENSTVDEDKEKPTACQEFAINTCNIAQSPVMEKSIVETPRTSCWETNKCRILCGVISGAVTLITVIGAIVGVLSYLNDICVFPKCEDGPDPVKPCWDNDVNYKNDLGITHNLHDGNIFRKDTVQECELSCEKYANQGCQFWSYNKKEHWCSLKSDRVANPILAGYYISGSRGCKVPENFLDVTIAYNKKMNISAVKAQ